MIDSRSLFGFNEYNVLATPDIREVLDKRFFSPEAREGEYVIYRRMLKDQLSDNWDPEKKEYIGGYKYKYVDSIIKVRRSWVLRLVDMESQKPIGAIEHRQPILYCRYDINPQYEDEFFTPKTPITSYSHIIVPDDYYVRFTIIQVIPYNRLDGRIEYYTCILKEDLKI